MKEITIRIPEVLRGAQLLDEKVTSVVDPAQNTAATRESVRGGGPAAQLEELREQLEQLRVQLERQKKTPDPALTAQLQKRDEELVVEIERTRATRTALDGVLAEFKKAVAQLRQEPERLKLELQDSVIQLSTVIASRLIRDRVDAGDYPIEKIVRELVGHLETTDPVTVSLNPADLDLLRERLTDAPLIENGPEITWEADAALERGTCHATTEDMTVSHVVQEQLANIIDTLREKGCWD